MARFDARLAVATACALAVLVSAAPAMAQKQIIGLPDRFDATWKPREHR
jgi:hypothetical protein